MPSNQGMCAAFSRKRFPQKAGSLGPGKIVNSMTKCRKFKVEVSFPDNRDFLPCFENFVLQQLV